MVLCWEVSIAAEALEPVLREAEAARSESLDQQAVQQSGGVVGAKDGPRAFEDLGCPQIPCQKCKTFNWFNGHPPLNHKQRTGWLAATKEPDGSMSRLVAPKGSLLKSNITLDPSPTTSERIWERGEEGGRCSGLR